MRTTVDDSRRPIAVGPAVFVTEMPYRVGLYTLIAVLVLFGIVGALF